VEHLPVLAAEAVEWLAPWRGGWFVDCTLGLGGHAEALLEAGEGARLLGIDRDPQALSIAPTSPCPNNSRTPAAGAFRWTRGVRPG